MLSASICAGPPPADSAPPPRSPSVPPQLPSTSYDVFLSHKGEDIRRADAVGKTLHFNGLRVYLDIWDPRVEGDSPELEDYLRHTIRETSAISALVTENTPLSWWVPFEIEVARETGSQIATFLEMNAFTSVELPSYLRKWPIFASEQSLHMWARRLADASVYEGRLHFAKGAPQRSDFPDGIDSLVQSGKVVFR